MRRVLPVSQRPDAAPPAPAPVRRSAEPPILQLQRSVGNAAVARAVLARRFDPKAHERSMAEKAKFMAWTYETLRWRPSTGGGSFDALYEPKTGTLTITVKCKFWFDDGKESDFKDAEADPDDYWWKAKEILAFKEEFTRRVSAHWSDQFTFHCTRPWWEDLQATVRVRFVEADEKDAHYIVNVKKIPDMDDRKSRVRRPKSHGARGVAFLDSQDLIQSDGQTPAFHEAGHMLGLGDEYPKKTKKPVSHAKLVQKEFGHGVPRKRDDRQMASGNQIRPEHGVTFLEVLRLVTGMQEWSYNARAPAPVLSEPVDGPMPSKSSPLGAGTSIA